jgi:acetolactate synthase-1/2/3 large subunit
MRVAEAVGRRLGQLLGPEPTVFGVVGSGNFHVTNALIAAGASFVPARHEGGAAVMADAWARTTGRIGLLSVHQGPGLTNAMTGITEAAKSRTRLLVLAAEATQQRSNFYLDVARLADAVGAVHVRLESLADARRAAQAAVDRRTVILSLPLDVQAAECEPLTDQALSPATRAIPDPAAVNDLASILRDAKRPVFIAGRGARGYRKEIERTAERCGALLATSAAAKGLFHGNPRNLDVSGGFASPVAAELISGADVIVAWGCALNMWTTRHGTLIDSGTKVVRVDDDPSASADLLGDVGETAAALADTLTGAPAQHPPLRSVRWRDVPFTDESDGERIDPRALTIALDDIFPASRTVAIDSGNFMGYPSMYLSVPDETGFVFTQAFQSIGLGLASAIGAAVARPDRLTIAALGDGGALMGVSELETVVRLGLPMVVVVYDDEAYGAEVHHFGPGGFDLSTVRFPPTDIAAIARGFGFEAITARAVPDLAPVRAWVNGPRDHPLLIHAKVTSNSGAWWLEEAFRGH